MALTPNIPYLSDAQRVRQFRRYYQSKHLRHLQTLDGAVANPDNQALPSPSEADYTLSAIAKCVVHSVDVDKAMISLLDDKTQYFLGGATKQTSSIVRGDENQELWFGCSTIGIRGGICELACSVTPENRHYPFYVVPDIADVPQWRDVVGTYRFYVGIPIKTRSQHNIGTLFGFSTRPRPSLEPEEKLVMERMANAVMTHLELELSVLERSRLLCMNQSLATFASNTKPTVARNMMPVMPRAGLDESPRSLPRDDLPDMSSLSSATMLASAISASASLQGRIPSTATTGLQQDLVAPELTRQPNATWQGTPPLPSPERGGSPDSTLTHRATPVAHALVFERAAELLRSGLNCTGVVFLATDSEPHATPEPSRVNVLGGAVIEQAQRPQDFEGDPVRDVLKSYPNGHLFYFDRAGQPWAVLQEEEEASSRSYQPHISYPGLDAPIADEQDPVLKNLAKSLQKAMPMARQILITPLRSARDDLLCAAIAWRDDWTAILTRTVELPFMTSFCWSVFASVMHEDALASNRQKTDFLANITHELRSPLHGVLATVDLLQDTPHTPAQQLLIEDIQICGRVLLNTIDQLLDLSELSASNVTVVGRRNKSLPATTPSLSAQQRRESQVIHQPADTDLAALCEDAIDSVLLSHTFHHAVRPVSNLDMSGEISGRSSNLPKPIISLDIACRDWECSIQPGAFQRLIMNLLGNAAKYTETGFIRLQLDARDGDRVSNGSGDVFDSLVVLTISDSGRGISPEFIQTRLWTPFAQEDQNVHGAGLGLSITKQIVTALSGTIDVQSTVGRGTTVTVKLPTRMLRSNGSSEYLADRPPPRVVRMRQRVAGRVVGLILRRSSVDARSKLEARGLQYSTQSLVRCLKTWFGLQVIVDPSPGAAVDFIIVDEERLGSSEIPRRAPCIILEDRLQFARRRRPDPNSRSLSLKRPIAPGTLERALSALSDREQQFQATSSESSIVLALESSSLDTVVESQQGAEGPSNPEASHTQMSLTLDVAKLQVEIAPGGVNGLTAEAPAEPVPRVLMVDDNAINLKVLYKFLVRQKISPDNIVRATNGLEAVAAYASTIEAISDDDPGDGWVNTTHGDSEPQSMATTTTADGRHVRRSAPPTVAAAAPFDLVLMDLNMPVLDGFGATRQIRAMEKTRSGGGRGAKGPPPSLIVALTGLVSERDRQEAFDAGVDIFCSKPFAKAEVAGLLEAWRRQRAEWGAVS